MPTILRLDGLRVAIYANDHRPAHVHVVGSGGEAVFILDCPGGPVSLRGSYGFNGQALRKLEASLNRIVTRLCDFWEMIHGAY